jgi:hypothetical protein
MTNKLFQILTISLIANTVWGQQLFSSPINYWQTYFPSGPSGIHFYTNEKKTYEISKLKRFDDEFKTGYGYINQDGEVIFYDAANCEKNSIKCDSYLMKDDTNFTYLGRISNTENKTSRVFSNNTHIFYLKKNQVYSCKKNNKFECQTIEVQENSSIFVFSQVENHVLAATNWGDVVKFDGAAWCRMSRDTFDVFKCDTNEPIVTQPRKIQFYSSIVYQGEVLIGEWPTGSIYEFDGQTLRPSAKWTPPPFVLREKQGFEAQTMAEYCGDLFVGYWPKGEIWRYSRIEKKWIYFVRFFSYHEQEAFIPFSDRATDNLNSAFFGQRVTALLPYEDSLYAVTANLNSWKSSVFSSALTKEQQDQYGSVWKIRGDNCLTTYEKTIQ